MTNVFFVIVKYFTAFVHILRHLLRVWLRVIFVKLWVLVYRTLVGWDLRESSCAIVWLQIVLFTLAVKVFENLKHLRLTSRVRSEILGIKSRWINELRMGNVHVQVDWVSVSIDKLVNHFRIFRIHRWSKPFALLSFLYWFKRLTSIRHLKKSPFFIL